MKKLITIAAIILAVSVSNVNGQSWYSGESSGNSAGLTTATTNKITWEEQSKDLGRVKQYSQTEVKFVMKNSGTQAVSIIDAQKSCGCTNVEFPRKPILPGKTATIIVSYDAEDLGVFKKEVTMIFSEGVPKQVIYFHGEVIK